MGINNNRFKSIFPDHNPLLLLKTERSCRVKIKKTYFAIYADEKPGTGSEDRFIIHSR